MPEFSFSVLSRPTIDALKALDKQIDDASKQAVSDAGKQVQRTARALAPVYGGKHAATLRAVKKARRAGVTLSGAKLRKGQLVEGSKVVAGLLRDGITSGRARNTGDGWAVKILPRGPRVHLYAGKEEQREGFMAKAFDVTLPLVRGIHEKAWAKVVGD